MASWAVATEQVVWISPRATGFTVVCDRCASLGETFPSVQATLSLEHAARAWALLSGRSFVVPEDCERLLLPVLAHRIVFTPLFLAEARKLGWEQAIDRFRIALLERAPRPELPDGEVVFLDRD